MELQKHGAVIFLVIQKPHVFVLINLSNAQPSPVQYFTFFVNLLLHDKTGEFEDYKSFLCDRWSRPSTCIQTVAPAALQGSVTYSVFCPLLSSLTHDWLMSLWLRQMPSLPDIQDNRFYSFWGLNVQLELISASVVGRVDWFGAYNGHPYVSGLNSAQWIGGSKAKALGYWPADCTFKLHCCHSWAFELLVAAMIQLELAVFWSALTFELPNKLKYVRKKIAVL